MVLPVNILHAPSSKSSSASSLACCFCVFFAFAFPFPLWLFVPFVATWFFRGRPRFLPVFDLVAGGVDTDVGTTGADAELCAGAGVVILAGSGWGLGAVTTGGGGPLLVGTAAGITTGAGIVLLAGSG